MIAGADGITGVVDAGAGAVVQSDAPRKDIGTSDWSPVVLTSGQTVYSALERRGIRPTRELLLVIAERNEISDYSRLAVGQRVWLPRPESIAARAGLSGAAAQSVGREARLAVESDLAASRPDKARPAELRPAATQTTMRALELPGLAVRRPLQPRSPAPEPVAADALAVQLAAASDPGPEPALPLPAVPEPALSAVPGRQESAILALDPENLTPEQIKLLPAELAPRVMLLKGLFDIGDMSDLGKFFIAMGYPEQKLKNPDGSLSMSSHRSSEELAGTVAWYFEKEGVAPVLIGHSQGGYMTTKVLYELAGQGSAFEIWNPVEGRSEGRTTIRDPKTGEERSPTGIRLPLAATLATGRLMRVLLPWQWSMLPRLYSIPDTAERFVTFNMSSDVIGMGWEPAEPAPGSRTQVRNIRLPANHSHIGLPDTSHLAAGAATRQFIDTYVPPEKGAPGVITPPAPPETNLIQAAELWRALTRAWCVEAQRQLGKDD